MKKVLFFIVIAAFLQNCSFAHGYSIGQGSLFTNVTLNKDVSTAAELGTKTGEACASGFLYLLAFGDAGVKQAVTNGNIKIVKAVDVEYTNAFFGLFQSHCTVVRGD